jgi:Arc/MetJ-type ribon-helix-helix transcriptional regulator
MPRMKERVSISVESDVLDTVREEVETGAAPNLSAAIESALRDRARTRALDRLLEEFAAQYPDQPLTDAERAWAREALGRGEAPR